VSLENSIEILEGDKTSYEELSVISILFLRNSMGKANGGNR